MRRDGRSAVRLRPGRTTLVAALSTALAVLIVLLTGSVRATAALGPTWWKVDLHEHSAFSGDAKADLGIDAAMAKAANYNAVFLTDHDRMSGFEISGTNGNYLSYRDSLSSRWSTGTGPSPLPTGSSTTNAVVTSPVHSGTNSLHIAATAPTSTQVRSYVYAARAPGIRSGDVTLDFWVYPKQISAGSGVDVSVSLGGDLSIGAKPYGYTTQDGVPHLGKSTILVWQLGSARTASANGTTDVFTSSLPYTLNTWNHYVIDVMTGAGTKTVGNSSQALVTTGLNALPPADKPADYDVLANAKIEAAAVSGTADAYFDDYTIQVAQRQCPATEFVYRNSLIDGGSFNGTNAGGSQFVIFPAREMGKSNHANQFNFDITNANQFYDDHVDNTVPQNDGTLCASSNAQWVPPWKFTTAGTDNVATVQASGYPVQDNHPGTTDTTSDVISTVAHGADAVEEHAASSDYSTTWDAILQQNHVIIGTSGSDAHTGVGQTTPSSFIDAPTLSLNDLMHSLFEGRLYLANGNFAGRLVFNLDGSPRPYPARYPVYVPSTQTSAAVRLSISAGLVSGEKVVWYYNSGSGDTTITDTVSTATYSATKTIPLSGSFTYVRAAVLSSSNALIANTEPIFFEGVSGLPAGASAHVDTTKPPTGTCSCTTAMTKGITAASFASGAFALTLTNPAGSVTDLVGSAAAAPQSVTMDGAAVPMAATLAAYQAAAGDSWFYDGAGHVLYLQDAQAGGTSSISIKLSASGPNSPPTANPVSINATSGAATNWTPSVSDPDFGQTLTCSIVTQPAHGSATVNPNCSSGTYTSQVGFTGSDPFTYKVNDGTVDSSAATVSTNVSAAPPVVLVQQQTASGNAVTLSDALGAPTHSGDVLVATIALSAGSSASVTSVADSSGGAWTKGPVGFLTGTNTRVEIWYRLAAPPVSTVTVTLSAAKSAAVNVSEWSGVAAASAVDQTAQAGAASSTAVSTPSVTTTNPKDVVIGAVNYPAAATSTLTGATFTSLNDFNYSSSVHGRAAYVVTGAAGTYQATWSLSVASGGNGGVVIALKAA